MTRIDLSALNEAERERYYRQQARFTGRHLPRLAIPPIVYVGIFAAGIAAVLTPAFLPWGQLLGLAGVAVGAYGLGVASAPVGGAQRDSSRVDRLTDVLSVAFLRGGYANADGDKPAPPAPEGAAVRRPTRVPHRRRPKLHALGGGVPGIGTDALDAPLSGEADLDGVVG